MSRSFKRVPIIKGPRHKTGRSKEKKTMRRMLRAKLKRMECLLQHQDSKRVETIPWYNRYEDYFFDWRWYEQKGISHALMMCIYDDVEEAIEQETKWRKKAKRRAYGK